MIKKLRKLIRWAKIIWNDRDDDFIFLYIIIYEKIKDMKEYLEYENKYYIESDNKNKEITEMHTIMIYLDRLIHENNYHNMSYGYKSEYGKIESIEEQRDRLIRHDMNMAFEGLKVFSRNWYN